MYKKRWKYLKILLINNSLPKILVKNILYNTIIEIKIIIQKIHMKLDMQVYGIIQI